MRRDRRFLVRLVLGMLLATLGGALVFMQLTSRRTAGCAASMVTDEPAPEPSSGP